MKDSARKFKIRVIGVEYYPFDILTFLKYKKELYEDVLLLTILRNPLERVFILIPYQDDQ